MQVIGFKAPCQKYDLERALVTNSPELQAYYLEHKKIFDYVATHSGFEITSDDVLTAVERVWDLYDDLFIEVST